MNLPIKKLFKTEPSRLVPDETPDDRNYFGSLLVRITAEQTWQNQNTELED